MMIAMIVVTIDDIVVCYKYGRQNHMYHNVMLIIIKKNEIIYHNLLYLQYNNKKWLLNYRQILTHFVVIMI